jgi:hypothetical protein
MFTNPYTGPMAAPAPTAPATAPTTPAPMRTGWGSALIGGLTTGFSPAQAIDISQYYGPNQQPQRQDNTILYIAIIAAVLVAAGTIYFVTRK